MGISQVPAPSFNRNWVEIATSTPTGVSTVSFTSLTAYNFYKITYVGTLVSTGSFYMTLNNSTSNYIHTAVYDTGSRLTGVGSQTSFDFRNSASSSSNSIMITLDNTSGLTTATGTVYGGGRFYNSFEGSWNTKEQINRIDLVADANYSTGTIKIYGSN